MTIHYSDKSTNRESEHAIALSMHTWLREAAQTQLAEQQAAAEQEKKSMDILDHITRYFFGSEPVRKHERRFVNKHRR